MKALLLCQNLGVGGAEELVLRVSTNLHREGIECAAVAITRSGRIAREIAEAGVRLVEAPGQPGPRDPRAFANLVRLIRRERPDVVHTYLLNACLYGRLAAIVAGVPAIFAAEQNVYREKRRRHALLERLLATRTARVVACCRTVAEAYRRQVGVAAAKVAVVYNAVQFEPEPDIDQRRIARRRLGLDDDTFVVGNLGRLTEQKGHTVLLEATARLAKRHRGLAVLIAGEGPLRRRLEDQAERLGMARRVHLLGLRRDRATLYGAMDAFALPSRWEGLSLALVEAMGAGRPVVATTVGGNPEVVEHERSGLLVPPDNPNRLEAALESLLVDPARAGRLGRRAAREVRARFAIEQHVRQIAELYRAALGGVTPRPGPRVGAAP
jgi:glycosyltransferase involved in cell wall biosynthesis